MVFRKKSLTGDPLPPYIFESKCHFGPPKSTILVRNPGPPPKVLKRNVYSESNETNKQGYGALMINPEIIIIIIVH